MVFTIFLTSETNGLYYKNMMIVKDDSSIVNKLGASLTDDTRVVIYIHHMFIVKATNLIFCKKTY
jgi:hypothetical protein